MCRGSNPEKTRECSHVTWTYSHQLSHWGWAEPHERLLKTTKVIQIHENIISHVGELSWLTVTSLVHKFGQKQISFSLKPCFEYVDCEIFPRDVLCESWSSSIDPFRQRTHVFHIGRPSSRDALRGALKPKTHRKPREDDGIRDTATAWQPTLKRWEGERERERRMKSEEADLFPGASSETWRDGFSRCVQPERVYMNPNHPDRWNIQFPSSGLENT